MQVAVYRASKRDEMYAYIRKADTEEAMLAVIPANLRQAMGQLTYVMALTLTPERKLARVAVADVLAQLTEHGYFIQMPPGGLIDPDAVAPPGLQGA